MTMSNSPAPEPKKMPDELVVRLGINFLGQTSFKDAMPELELLTLDEQGVISCGADEVMIRGELFQKSSDRAHNVPEDAYHAYRIIKYLRKKEK